MGNFELQADEVILYEGTTTSREYKGTLQTTLSSYKLVLEKEKGVFKKEKELIDIILLENVKFYNGEVQVKQKGSEVVIQTIEKNITLVFYGMLEAKKFAGKMIDAITQTTIISRGSEKVKNAFDVIDDTLGLDTRATIKGLLENGVKGTIIKGIGKK